MGRKVFVSYSHRLDQSTADDFRDFFSNQRDVFVDKSIREDIGEYQNGDVKGDGVEFRRFFFHLGDVKGDGVEFGRFFFHLFVVMKSHATSSQNRCAGCLASYHMQGYRTTKHF